MRSQCECEDDDCTCSETLHDYGYHLEGATDTRETPETRIVLLRYDLAMLHRALRERGYDATR